MKTKSFASVSRVFLICITIVIVALLAGCEWDDVEINYILEIIPPKTPVRLGDNYTVSIKITEKKEMPKGTYDITDSAGKGCKGKTLSAGGSGSCSLPSSHLSVGTEKITATFYKEDSNSSGQTVTSQVTIEPRLPSVKILEIELFRGYEHGLIGPGEIYVGDVIVFLVKVEGSSPTGTVEIVSKLNNIFEGDPAPLDKYSVAEITTLVTKEGMDLIQVSYSGDSNNLPNVSETLTFNAYQWLQHMEIQSPLPAGGPLVVGQPVEVVVRVFGESSYPTGTVTIAGDTECTAELFRDNTHWAEGACEVSFTSFQDEAVITATYHGDAAYQPDSTSMTYDLTEYMESTTTIVDVLPKPPMVGEWVTVIVEVKAGGVTPDGTVTITGADTTCTIDLAIGEDRCSVMFNSQGVKTLIAYYSGTVGVNPSQDTITGEVTKPEPTPTPKD